MSTIIRDYALWFIGLGVASFLANVFQLYSFGKMGEFLTLRLRQLSFAAILRQDVGMYVCVYVYVCMCMHVCVFVYVAFMHA